jgi:hypothetical protein
MHFEAGGHTCLWQVRDRETWRAGVLFTASADFLVAWHAVAAGTPPRAWASVDRRLRDIVNRVRRSRLARDLDDVGAACRELLDRADTATVRASQLWAELESLRERLAPLTAAANPCLLGCDIRPCPAIAAPAR